MRQLLDFGERGEGIEFNPVLHITGRRGLIAGGAAVDAAFSEGVQADALQLVALSPFASVGTQDVNLSDVNQVDGWR